MSSHKFKDIPLNKDFLLKIAPVIAGIRVYHQHSTVGLDHIPKGGCIIAANHSLASYDIALLIASIYEHTNRIPRGLIDRLFFKVPGVGQIMEALGNREGTKENAVNMLSEGEIIVLAPGGMREALRPSSQKYKIIWDHRKGFAKLAIETGVPIVLAACPAADDLYDVAPSHVTAWAYKTFKIPVFFAKGFALSPIPKPVKLTHYLSEPMMPPANSEDPEVFDKRLEEYHHKIVERMASLMAESDKINVGVGK
ncbi:MAG: lysophospholipid acyltransferase family protein [Pseudomonadota bacterium]